MTSHERGASSLMAALALTSAVILDAIGLPLGWVAVGAWIAAAYYMWRDIHDAA